MTPHILDNPIHAALRSRHAPYAQHHGDVGRYPRAIAPFLGVPDTDVEVGHALDALVPADDAVFLLGPVPAMPMGWRLQGPTPLVQMVCEAPVDAVDAHDIVPLTDAHQADVLALTALVYPHYFRPRTTVLGRYFGIYEDGRLAAMIGERMATDAWQEISAVCTHPDFNGRGLARRLLVWLSNDILASGRTPFLHVSPANTRAVALYERNGYRTRTLIDFWALRRIEVGVGA